jgi:hypothetical protein
MTKDEAMGKWCPLNALYTISAMQQLSSVSKDEALASCRCSADNCMMWRREKDTYGDDYGKDIPEDRGFCGLAGKI